MVYHIYNILIHPFLGYTITTANVVYLTDFLRICRFPKETKWLFKFENVFIYTVFCCYCCWDVLTFQIKN